MIPLCRFCPSPAHFNFGEGAMLCAECAAAMLERCKISSSELRLSCVVRAGAPAEINDRSHPSPMHDGRTWEQRTALTNGDSLVLQRTLTGRGPCDSGAPISNLAGSLQREAPVVADTASTAMAGASIEDGIPEFLRRAI